MESDVKNMTLSENGVEENVMVVKTRTMGVRPWRLSVDPVRAVMDTIIAGVGWLLYVSLSIPFFSVRDERKTNCPIGCSRS